jgi:type I restriction enzyme S subunit
MIPNGWQQTTIGRCLTIRHGRNQSQVVDPHGEFPILGSGGEIGRASSFLHDKPSVLIGRKGTIDRPRYMDTPFWTVDTLFYSEVHSDVEPKFIYYVFLTIDWRSLNEASGVPSLNASTIEAVAISIPGPMEQKLIAEVLSDTDALVESLDALIAKKRDMKQAAMQQLLTGRTRLPGFDDEWNEVSLGETGSCLRGVSYNPQADLSDRDGESTVRLLRSNNVQQSLLAFEDVQYVDEARVSVEQFLRPEDIVVCMANGSKALVGKSGFFTEQMSVRYTFGAFMGCFRTDRAKANPGFVRYLFLTKRYQDYINNLLAGSAINNLAPSSIESLRFVVPSPHEQQAIAEVLSDMDAEIDALVAQREKADLVKQGMMQELLSGRVRLV